MIVEYIRYRIDDVRREAFEDSYATAQASLQSSPHCLGWELGRCSEDPGQDILRIEGDSAEGHLQGCRRGPEIPSFLSSTRPFFDDIEEMRQYEVTGVNGQKTSA